MNNTLESVEKEWLTALKNGSQQGLKKIFNQYYKYLLVTANHYVADTEKAKDIVQDVFFELWKKREHLQVNTSLKAYLRKAAVNRSLNYIKSQKRFHFGDEAIEMNLMDREERADQVLEASDLQQVVNRAVDSLPERCRLVYLLSRKEHLSHKKISEQLDISLKTIENQMTKALKVIRQSVEAYGIGSLLAIFSYYSLTAKQAILPLLLSIA